MSACAEGAAGGSTSSDEVVVALVAPTSGFAANYGPEALQGVDLALDEVKSKVGDQNIKVIKVDEDVLDPSQTLQRIKSAVEGDGADIVIGPIFGSSQQAVSAYLTQAGVPMFTTLGGDTSLAGDNSAFVWPGADSKTASPLGTYAAEDLGYKTIATLAPDYAYGHNAMKGITDAFTAAGGTVAQQQWVPLGTTDMLQYATAMDKNVDALAMWLVPTDAAAFIKEYRNLDIKVPLLLFQGVFDPTFQDIGGQLIGEVGLNEWNHLLDNPANKTFTDAYAAKYDGGIPNQTTAFSYTVMKNIITALDADGGDTSVAALRKALAGRKLDTVSGPAEYNEDGIAAGTRTIVKAAKLDGRYEWEPVKTYDNIGN